MGEDLYFGLLWSVLEVTTSFVIACMPATRLVLMNMFPVLREHMLGSFVFRTVFNTRSKRSRFPVSGTASDGIDLRDVEDGRDAGSSTVRM